MTLSFTTQVSRAVAWAVVGLLVGVLIVGAIVLAVQTQNAAEQARHTTRNTNKVAHAVLDCTTPGGKCFKRSKRATARAVGDINRVIVLAATCADMPGDQTQRQIERCVLHRLASKP